MLSFTIASTRSFCPLPSLDLLPTAHNFGLYWILSLHYRIYLTLYLSSHLFIHTWRTLSDWVLHFDGFWFCLLDLAYCFSFSFPCLLSTEASFVHYLGVLILCFMPARW